MKVLKQLPLWLVCLAGIWPTIASAWWNEDWSYRLPIHLDTSAAGAGIATTQNDVPLLVSLHTGNFKDFFLLKENLADLRFIAGDDKTPLKFHVEKFDLINQLMFIWVRVPQVTGSLNTEKIWMYYGNENAVTAADAGGTYDVNTVMTQHFRAGAALLQDQTAFANNLAAPVAEAVVEEPASLIGGGLRFVGKGGVDLPVSASTAMLTASGMTASFWVKPDDAKPAVLFSRRDGDNAITLENTDAGLVVLLNANGQRYETTPAPYTAAWQHVALVVSENRIALFVNGAEADAIDAPIPDMGGVVAFGADASGGFAFRGVIDEIGYANVARAPDYIRLLAENQGMVNKLLQTGDGEQLGNAGGGESHFGFIMKKLTFDAKVVILALAVMSILSWIVMIMKGLYLGRIVKDNKKFLSAYYELGSDDPAMLDRGESETDKELEDSPVAQALFGSHDHFQSSPIYHMYHRGIREVKMRVGTAAGAQATAMSEQSSNAIRASMDAEMVREMQKVNSKMVWLTIAISGGPFIGLLGTVIGVMITFADMASSGDVNIASIAPGMAAALMATVAGLWVAIPALFGYNYLGSRIKDITADMHVFIDEFVTRVAEYYGQG